MNSFKFALKVYTTVQEGTCFDSVEETLKARNLKEAEEQICKKYAGQHVLITEVYEKRIRFIGRYRLIETPNRYATT